MEIIRNEINCQGLKLVLQDGYKKEIGRAFVYIMWNDLHQRPFALLEDVFIKENWRGKGWGSRLIKEATKVAREKNCYKLIATSRSSRLKVHQLYSKLGWTDYGKEFRIDF